MVLTQAVAHRREEGDGTNEQRDFHKLLKYRPNTYHHVTFPTKRRRPVLAGEVRQRVHYWFDEIACQHDYQLLERNTWLDHAHLLIFVRIGENLSAVMHQLKGESARRIFLEFDGLKQQIGLNNLWGRRFRAEAVPPEAVEQVRQYIRNQEATHTRRAGYLPVARLERWRVLEL